MKKRWITSSFQLWLLERGHKAESAFIKNIGGNITFVLAGLHVNGQSPVPGSERYSKGVDQTHRPEQREVAARWECDGFFGTL